MGAGRLAHEKCTLCFGNSSGCTCLIVRGSTPPRSYSASVSDIVCHSASVVGLGQKQDGEYDHDQIYNVHLLRQYDLWSTDAASPLGIIYSCAHTPLGLCPLGRHRKASDTSSEASLLPVYVGKIVEQSAVVLTHMRPPVDSLLKYTRGSFGVDLPDFLDLPVAEPDTYDVNEIENTGVGSAAILAQAVFRAAAAASNNTAHGLRSWAGANC